MNHENWTTVFISQGMLVATVIKGKLEFAGIPVLLKYEAVGQILGLTVDGLGRVEVTVPSADADAARALLEEGWVDDEDGSPELDVDAEP